MNKNLAPEYFKPFPAYEDVFYDDIENHKKYFLPICSINLKCVDPNLDEWVHFNSTVEIYDGALAEHTNDYQTPYSARDMFSFDVIEDKYKFEGDWRYFYSNHEHLITQNKQIIDDFKTQSFDRLQHYYDWIDTQPCSQALKIELKRLLQYKIKNEKDYQGKSMYKGILTNYSEVMLTQKSTLKDLKKAYQDNFQEFNQAKHKFSNGTKPDDEAEFYGFVNDLKFQSQIEQEDMKELDLTYEQMLQNLQSELVIFPQNKQNKMFEYVGKLTGYYFQSYGADSLVMFKDDDLKKVVFVLSYS